MDTVLILLLLAMANKIFNHIFSLFHTTPVRERHPDSIA